MEKFRYISDVRYTASRDIVDTIKLEGSCISPQKDTELKSKGKAFERAFVIRYQSYIQPEQYRERSEADQRIVVTDSDTYFLFGEYWPSPPKEFTGSVGQVFTQGSIIHISDIQEFVYNLPGDQDKFLKAKAQEQGLSVGDIIPTLWNQILAHETVHLYQYPILPVTFHECAARYYARQLLEDTGNKVIYFPLDLERITLYEILLEQYGEDVHKVFFGTIDNSNQGTDRFARWEKIISAITPKINENMKLT